MRSALLRSMGGVLVVLLAAGFAADAKARQSPLS